MTSPSQPRCSATHKSVSRHCSSVQAGMSLGNADTTCIFLGMSETDEDENTSRLEREDQKDIRALGILARLWSLKVIEDCVALVSSRVNISTEEVPLVQ